MENTNEVRGKMVDFLSVDPTQANTAENTQILKDLMDTMVIGYYNCSLESEDEITLKDACNSVYKFLRDMLLSIKKDQIKRIRRGESLNPAFIEQANRIANYTEE